MVHLPLHARLRFPVVTAVLGSLRTLHVFVAFTVAHTVTLRRFPFLCLGFLLPFHTTVLVCPFAWLLHTFWILRRLRFTTRLHGSHCGLRLRLTGSHAVTCVTHRRTFLLPDAGFCWVHVTFTGCLPTYHCHAYCDSHRTRYGSLYVYLLRFFAYTRRCRFTVAVRTTTFVVPGYTAPLRFWFHAPAVVTCWLRLTVPVIPFTVPVLLPVCPRFRFIILRLQFCLFSCLPVTGCLRYVTPPVLTPAGCLFTLPPFKFTVGSARLPFTHAVLTRYFTPLHSGCCYLGSTHAGYHCVLHTALPTYLHHTITVLLRFRLQLVCFAGYRGLLLVMRFAHTPRTRYVVPPAALAVGLRFAHTVHVCRALLHTVYFTVALRLRLSPFGWLHTHTRCILDYRALVRFPDSAVTTHTAHYAVVYLAVVILPFVRLLVYRCTVTRSLLQVARSPLRFACHHCTVIHRLPRVCYTHGSFWLRLPHLGRRLRLFIHTVHIPRLVTTRFWMRLRLRTRRCTTFTVTLLPLLFTTTTLLPATPRYILYRLYVCAVYVFIWLPRFVARLLYVLVGCYCGLYTRTFPVTGSPRFYYARFLWFHLVAGSLLLRLLHTRYTFPGYRLRCCCYRLFAVTVCGLFMPALRYCGSARITVTHTTAAFAIHFGYGLVIHGCAVVTAHLWLRFTFAIWFFPYRCVCCRTFPLGSTFYIHAYHCLLRASVLLPAVVTPCTVTVIRSGSVTVLPTHTVPAVTRSLPATRCVTALRFRFFRTAHGIAPYAVLPACRLRYAFTHLPPALHGSPYLRVAVTRLCLVTVTYGLYCGYGYLFRIAVPFYVLRFLVPVPFRFPLRRIYRLYMPFCHRGYWLHTGYLVLHVRFTRYAVYTLFVAARYAPPTIPVYRYRLPHLPPAFGCAVRLPRIAYVYVAAFYRAVLVRAHTLYIVRSRLRLHTPRTFYGCYCWLRTRSVTPCGSTPHLLHTFYVYLFAVG